MFVIPSPISVACQLSVVNQSILLMLEVSLQAIQCRASTADVVHGQVLLSAPFSVSDKKWLPHSHPWKCSVQTVQCPKHGPV
jgi:hypothetical protein